MLKVERLRADRLNAPIGIDHAPALSWTLRSDARNVVQKAFRVQLSNDGFNSLVWDSGEINSSESIEYILPYELESVRAYHWRVWVSDGTQSTWSDPSRFVTAFMTPAGWGSARFISADDAPDSSKATYVSTKFQVDGTVKSAYVFSTALGVYQLLLDKKHASADELAPGWTSYRKHLLYQTNDVTDLLTQGEHEIGGFIGVGWYKGQMGHHGLNHHYGDKTAFLMKMLIQYEDGRTQTLQTGEAWRGWDTPILFSDIYNGEQYDARMGFEHERDVDIVDCDMSILSAQAACRVQVMKEIPALDLFVTPKQETVVDFGQNLAGWVRFQASGAINDVIELQLFEALNSDGNVYTENLRGARQTIHYTIGQAGNIDFQPHFTFMGFRYAHVKKYPGTLAKEAFTSCAVYSQMEETGEFECSNPLLNRLWKNIQWGMRSNFVDVPTDCPQRNERLGWTGDAQVFCRTACLIMDTSAFFSKWLIDLSADQTPEGGVPHVVPDILTPYVNENIDRLLSKGTHSAAAWADCSVIMPWNVFMAFGNKRILEQQYLSMRAWVEFMRSHADGCVWTYGLQFGDWVALDAEEGSYFGATPSDLTCAAYYARSTELLAKTADVLDHQVDRKIYNKLHENIVKDFGSRFFDKAGNMTAQTQTAHVLALHFNLTPEKYQAMTVRTLMELIRDKGGHLSTGFIGTPYIAYALSENGAIADAYSLLLQEDYPSWLYQVKAGATTVWEHWDGIKPDGTMWSADMNSFNHYSYGAIGDWMFSNVAGINAVEPGYKRSMIHPRPNKALQHAKASLETVYGLISSEWAYDNETLIYRISVPANTSAEIILDANCLLKTDGLCFVRHGSLMRAVVGSGEYVIKDSEKPE